MNLSIYRDQALAELTKNVLSLGTNSANQLDPSSLSEKCVKEYAKRFQLSFNKQAKLQELYGTIDRVNYIRSAKLERSKKNLLKKQSRSIAAAETTASLHPPQIISPVSSDDGVAEKNPVVSEPALVISSTPKKTGAKINFNLESSFTEEPSAIDHVPQVAKPTEPEVIPYVVFSLPSSTSAFRLPEVEAEKPIVVAPLSEKSTNKENLEKPGLVSSTPITFGSFSRAFQAPNQATSPVVTNPPSNSLFFGMKLSTATTTSTTNTVGSSFFGGLKLAPSTTSSTINLPSSTPAPAMGSSLFGQNFASSVATNANILKDVTGAINLSPKEKPKVLTSSNSQEMPAPSLFGIKPSQPSNIETISTVTSTAPIISNDKPAEDVKTIPVPANIPALVTISFPATSTPVVAASQSSIFGKPVATAVSASTGPVSSTGTSIFGSSSLFGKTPAASSATETINFANAFSSSSSIFGSKPTPAAVATVAPSAPISSSKSSEFTSFSFASKPTTTTSGGVTISEITSEPTTEESSGTSESTASTVINTFSFANAAAPVSTTFGSFALQSEPNNVPASLTLTPTSTPVYGSPTTPISAVSSTTPAMVTPPPSTAAPVLSTPPASSAAFAGSFFGGLSITATTTTAGSTSSIFGKPAATTSSLFGSNVFSQKPNTTPTTSTETKPIFGTGGSLFGQSAQPSQENKPVFGQATGQENKSVFGMAQNTGTNQENKSLFGQAQGGFQSGGGSVFGGNTGGSSLFGSSNAFSGMTPTTQTNT